MDSFDRKILALLVEDGRRPLADIAGRIALSAPAVKRRVDRLRADGTLQGFTALLDYPTLGWHSEALIDLFCTPGTRRNDLARALQRHPEVVAAWSVAGDADAVARVRTRDNVELEGLIVKLQAENLVTRTRSQVVLSRLVVRPDVDLRLDTDEEP